MYDVYKVEVGDTIDSISRKHGMSSNELMSMNGLSSEVTQGQLIVVPDNNLLFDTYVVKDGDNMYQISNRYNIDLNTLLKINGLDQDDFIYPSQNLLIPKSDVIVYVTNEGDTLNKVADMLSTTVNDIIMENKNLYLLTDQLIVKTK